MSRAGSRRVILIAIAPVLLCAGLALLGVLGALAGSRSAYAGAPGYLPSGPAVDGTEPLPPGAVVHTVLSNMTYPIAMAFDPQGRLFYTEKTTGRVRLFANGTLQSSP